MIQRIANLISYGCATDSAEIPDYICEEDVTFLEQYLAAPEPSQKARADALCALRPVAPWSIIAITFTNKAANELKERLTRMLGTEALDVWAMTFHSACCRILRRDIEKLGFDRSFTIYDTSSTCATICAESASSRPSSVPLPLALSLRQFCIPTACSTSSSARSDLILWRKTG